MTNAEARFNNSLCAQKPEGSLRQTAQDVHFDSHTAPELWGFGMYVALHLYYIYCYLFVVLNLVYLRTSVSLYQGQTNIYIINYNAVTQYSGENYIQNSDRC